MYASNIGAIATVRKLSPVRRASSAASSLEWSEEYFDGMETPYTFSRAERVAGDGGDERGVDAAGEPDQDGAEAVLGGVRPQAHDQRRVDLLVVLQPRPRSRRPARLVGGSGSSESTTWSTRSPSSTTPRGRPGRRGRQVEVEDHAALRELRGTRDDLAAPVDDDRVAVEDQLVLAADHRRDTRWCSPPPGARLRTRSSRVSSFSRSYGEALMTSSSPAPGGPGGRHPAALLPEVLADRERDVDAVDTDDGHRVTRHEVAELVEDAVVGQMVLGEVQRDRAAVQYGAGVLRSAGRAGRTAARRSPNGRGSRRRRAAPRSPPRRAVRERAHGGPGGLDEGRPQREVLDGITGQHHLGERDQMRSLLGGVPGPVHDRLGVRGEIADGRVDLIQSEA